MDAATLNAIQAAHADVEAAKKKLAETLRDAAKMTVPNATLVSTDGADVALADLFAEKRDLILVHNMGKGCRWCTLWADGFRGYTDHLNSRAAFALVTPDDPDVARDFAKSRNWNFPVVTYGDSGLAATLGFEPTPGQYYPGYSALHKDDDGTITRTGMSHFGPGDDYCAVWPMFDQLKDGQNNWEPQYSYEKSGGCCSGKGCGCS